MKRRKPRVDREFAADVKADGAERASFRCERCKQRAIEQYHHKLMRSQGGMGTLDNLACLCAFCHAEVHANPLRSYEDGWLVRRGA